MKALVAGVGNIFLADDGFGVAVAQYLAVRSLPEGVKVVDYGIRGLDLAYALLEDYDPVIFVDIVHRGEAPGTLYLIEPEIDDGEAESLDAHGMDPVKVMALARSLGAPDRCAYLVACETAVLVEGEAYEDVMVELSEPVRAAVEPAARMVIELLENIAARLETPSEENDGNEIATFGFSRNGGRCGGDAGEGVPGPRPLFQNEIDVMA